MIVSAANARSERWSPNGSERNVGLCSLAGVTRALCTGSAMRSSSTDCPIAEGTVQHLAVAYQERLTDEEERKDLEEPCGHHLPPLGVPVVFLVAARLDESLVGGCAKDAHKL